MNTQPMNTYVSSECDLLVLSWRVLLRRGLFLFCDGVQLILTSLIPSSQQRNRRTWRGGENQEQTCTTTRHQMYLTNDLCISLYVNHFMCTLYHSCAHTHVYTCTVYIDVYSVRTSIRACWGPIIKGDSTPSDWVWKSVLLYGPEDRRSRSKMRYYM